MGTYAYSGNQNKQRDNHADEYLPDLLNDIQDEIEIVEQVLSGGEEGQVLTADSAGKAKWADSLNDIQDTLGLVVNLLSAIVIYDDVEITTVPNQQTKTNITTVTFLLNGNQITSPVVWVAFQVNDDYPIYRHSENGIVVIESGEVGASDYELHILLSTGEVKTISLTNQMPGEIG